MRPLLLLLDGHSSHYNPEAIRLAKANDVMMASVALIFTLNPEVVLHKVPSADPTTQHFRPCNCQLLLQLNYLQSPL